MRLSKPFLWSFFSAALLISAPAFAQDAQCTGVFETVVERMQLRWSNGLPNHPQFMIARPNRWHVIDFSQPQVIPGGKPTVPALPPDVCAVTLSVQVGGIIGRVPEDIVIFTDYKPFGAPGECGASAYTDTIVTHQMGGLRDSIGQISVPLVDRKMEWCWVVRSNYNAAGVAVGGPSTTAPLVQHGQPGRAYALVNLGLTGWAYAWRP